MPTEQLGYHGLHDIWIVGWEALICDGEVVEIDVCLPQASFKAWYGYLPAETGIVVTWLVAKFLQVMSFPNILVKKSFSQISWENPLTTFIRLASRAN